MNVVCAWCQRVLRVGTGDVSHGICPACERKQEEELDKLYVSTPPSEKKETTS